MTKLKKNAWIELAISLGVFAILAVVTALWDLQINKALYNQNSFYGQFFAQIGELPTYLAAPVIGAILFCQGFGKTNKQKLLWKILFGVVVFAGWFVAAGVWLWGRFDVSGVFETSTKDYDMVYKILLAGVLTFGTLLLASHFPQAVAKKLLWFAIFYVVVAAIPNALIAVMKGIWARERFRVMYAIGDFSGYTPWYLPQGFTERTAAYQEIRELADVALGHDGDAFKAFPSGHTGAAAASFALIILPDIMPKTLGGKKKAIFWLVPIAYVVLVAVSRVVAGAHYLSDTLFGGFLGFGTACLARWIFISKIKTLNKEPDEEPAVFEDVAPESAEDAEQVSGEDAVFDAESVAETAAVDETAEDISAQAEAVEATATTADN